jgi:site-specific DNA recombinase
LLKFHNIVHPSGLVGGEVLGLGWVAKMTSMTKRRVDGAVLYVRVSTDEQANGPLNLKNQEQRCRDYCKQNGLSVLEVFIDPGKSARTTARPAFQQMLSYCKSHRRDVRYVVVQDLSRFARDNGDQADAIVELGKGGIRVRSVYEPNVDETAGGRLAANILGAFNQYFSDSLSEKMRDRTRQALTLGRFPWRAPIGYQNIGGKEGPNIRPDEKRAPLIHRAFELVATALYKKSEALKIISEEGLTTLRGQPLSAQTLQAVLRNSLYAGWLRLPSDDTFEPVRGLHEPLISQELFDQVQAVLDGRKVTVAGKRAVNPLLPLKCFVRCEACGTPLTGGLVKGRNRKYARYWCRKKGCRAVKISKAQLESEFLELLRRLRVTPQTLTDFPRIAAKVWSEKQTSVEKTRRRLEKSLEEHKNLKRNLLKAKLREEISQADYEDANRQFTAEIVAIEERLQELDEGSSSVAAFLQFAELQLLDIGGAWQIAGPEQRQRVQTLLFRDGLDYSPRAGILNPANSNLFSALESLHSGNSLLASLSTSSLNQFANNLGRAEALTAEIASINNSLPGAASPANPPKALSRGAQPSANHSKLAKST